MLQTDSNGVVALYVSDRRQPFKKAMIPLPDDHERYNCWRAGASKPSRTTGTIFLFVALSYRYSMHIQDMIADMNRILSM